MRKKSIPKTCVIGAFLSIWLLMGAGVTKMVAQTNITNGEKDGNVYNVSLNWTPSSLTDVLYMNGTTAIYGETVTINYARPTGYFLSNIIVKMGSANLAVTVYPTNSQVSFTMPSGDVVVTATYKQITFDGFDPICQWQNPSYNPESLHNLTDAHGYIIGFISPNAADNTLTVPGTAEHYAIVLQNSEGFYGSVAYTEIDNLLASLTFDVVGTWYYTIWYTAQKYGAFPSDIKTFQVYAAPKEISIRTKIGDYNAHYNCDGDSIHLEVVADPADYVFNGTFEWTKDGAVVATTTEPLLVINPCDVDDAGNYNVTYTPYASWNEVAPCEVTLSEDFVVNVTPMFTPTITMEEGVNPTCYNSTATLCWYELLMYYEYYEEYQQVGLNLDDYECQWYTVDSDGEWMIIEGETSAWLTVYDIVESQTFGLSISYMFNPLCHSEIGMFTIMVNEDCEYYEVEVFADPIEGGWVGGGGSFENGTEVTVYAEADNDYTFINWTLDGNQVSTELEYTFTVTESVSLTAHFANCSGPSIFIQGEQYNCDGDSISLEVAAIPANYVFNGTFQWSKDGVVIATTTIPKLILQYIYYDYAGDYSVRYIPSESSYCEVESEPYHVYVSPLPSTPVIMMDVPNPIYSNNSATLMWNYGVLNPDSYDVQWYIIEDDDWIMIPGETDVTMITEPLFENTTFGLSISYANDFTLCHRESYPFTVIVEEAPVENYWIPESSSYEDFMAVIGVVQIDGVEQTSTTLELGAFCEDECRGNAMAAYFPPTDRYLYQLPVFGNNGDVITFKLYDHAQQQELDLSPATQLTVNDSGYGSLGNPQVINFISSVAITASVNPEEAGTVSGTGDYLPGTEITLTATANEGYAFNSWTENGTVVSTDPQYTFTVTGARHLTAVFDRVQTTALGNGWNWFSTYIEQEGIDGLAQLEESLGANGILIKSRQGLMVENYNGSYWWGGLTAIDNTQMYEVKTSQACEVSLQGQQAQPSQHPVTIKPGWNWIGYPCDTEMTLDQAMASLSPNEDDMVKSHTAFSSYFPNWGWYGLLETLEPGQGFKYNSLGNTNQSLVYPAPSKGSRTTTQADVNTHFVNHGTGCRDNMNLMATVLLDGVELAGDRYELAAFVGGVCRGAVKLMHVEPLQRDVAFLTVLGEASDKVSFRLYDEETGLTYEAEEVVTFEADAVLGNQRGLYPVRFASTDVAESHPLLFPNPVGRGERIMVENAPEGVTMEIVDLLGVTVKTVKLTGTHVAVDCDLVPGVYTVRMVKGQQTLTVEKLIVK